MSTRIIPKQVVIRKYRSTGKWHARAQHIGTVSSEQLAEEVPYGKPSIPRFDFQIMPGKLQGLVLSCFLNAFSRYSGPNLIRRHLGIMEYDGSGCDNGPLPYLSVVKNSSVHSYQRPIVDGASMNNSPMTDTHIIANDDGSAPGLMKAGTILNIDAVAHDNGIDVSAQYSGEPYRAVITHKNIAGKRSIVGEIAVSAHPGRLTFYSNDGGHKVR